MIMDVLFAAMIALVGGLLDLFDGVVPDGIGDDISAGIDSIVAFLPTSLINELVPLDLLAILVAARFVVWAVVQVVEFILWVIDNLPVIGS